MAPAIRKTISLPAATARRVSALAKSRKTTSGRLIVNLVEVALKDQESEREHYLGLVEQLASTKDPHSKQQLKRELARLTFEA